MKKESTAPVSRVLYRLHGACHLSNPRVTPWLKRSTLRRMSPGPVALQLRPSAPRAGNPHSDGLHELAAPSGHSPMITHWLVLSYTTFSPLPHKLTVNSCEAVVFFCPYLLSPIASTFGSGAPCAARTFLSCLAAPATYRGSSFGCKGKHFS